MFNEAVAIALISVPHGDIQTVVWFLYSSVHCVADYGYTLGRTWWPNRRVTVLCSTVLQIESLYFKNYVIRSVTPCSWVSDVLCCWHACSCISWCNTGRLMAQLACSAGNLLTAWGTVSTEQSSWEKISLGLLNYRSDQPRGLVARVSGY